MTSTTSNILWTTSLTLAVLGITFGIIASINASKANKKISNLIATSWIANEAQKILFDKLKIANIASRQIIIKLKEKITYNQYSIKSSQTRLYPISPRFLSALQDTEYKDLIDQYIKAKKYLDKMFKDIFYDFKILSTSKQIPKNIKLKIIQYHNQALKQSLNMIKLYSQLAINTKNN